MKLRELFAKRANEREIKAGTGPTKWCKTCSRYHASRVRCDLYMVKRAYFMKDGAVRFRTHLAHRAPGASR